MAFKKPAAKPAAAAAKPKDRAERAPAPKAAPQQSEQIEEQEEQSTALTTTSGGSAPAFITERNAEDSGAGLSNAMEDNLVPSAVIFQAGSPQVKRENPAYIEGAEAGVIWLRNYIDPLLDGAEGFMVQLCCVTKGWTEWLPRNRGGGGGKGFVARYDDKPADAKQVPNPENPKSMKWVTPEGNELSEGRQHIVRAFFGNKRFPFVINMSGSNHRTAKAWMTAMQQDVDQKGRAYAMYAGLWHLKAKYRNENGFDWYMWELDRMRDDNGAPAYVPTVADYEAGKALQNAFQTGQQRAEEYHDDVDGEVIDGSHGGDDNPLVNN